MSTHLFVRSLLATALGAFITFAPAARAASDFDETRIDAASLESAAHDAVQAATRQLTTLGDVEVEIVDLRAVPESPFVAAVDGVGRLRIEEGAWIPIRFLGGYHLQHRSLFGTRVLPISTARRSQFAAIDEGIQQQVGDQVAARVLSEFGQQPAEMLVLDLSPVIETRGHLAFVGHGVVDFAGEGIAPVTFNATLDRTSGLLATLDYALEIVDAHGVGADESRIVAAR